MTCRYGGRREELTLAGWPSVLGHRFETLGDTLMSETSVFRREHFSRRVGRTYDAAAECALTMTQSLPENRFVKDTRVNAVVSWVLTALLAVTAFFALTNARLDVVILAGAATAVALVPVLVSGRWTRTVPWPLLLVASFPLVFGATGTVVGVLAVGIGVSALALLVVVALQMTTAVRMTPRFALAFVFLMTLATAGFWAVTSAASARYFGTAFVETNDDLMVLFSAALLAGVVASGIFRWYFGRVLRENSEAADAGVKAA